MKKAWLIAKKDILIYLYDKSGFAFLILTPLILTLIAGAAFGGSSDDSANFQIPIAVVNYDTGISAAKIKTELPNAPNFEGLEMGARMIDILTSEDLRNLLATTVVTDEAAARAAINAGKSYTALIVLPKNLTRAVMLGEPAEIEMYRDPARATGAQIVEGIITQIARRMGSGNVLFNVTIQTLIESRRITPDGAPAVAQTLAAQMQADNGATTDIISLDTLDASGQTVKFNPLAFFAPSMAIIFLAFGTSQGARTILEEERKGTFSRLNATPTSGGMILFGKLLGILFTGVIQFGILLIATAVLFGLRWGDPLGVAVLSIGVIFAFTSLGLLLAVIAKDEGQANTLSTSVILVMMVIGGNLTPVDNFPDWLATIAKITPNYWSMAGFIKLGQAQSLANLLPELSALTLMSIVLFGAGMVLYRRRAQV